MSQLFSLTTDVVWMGNNPGRVSAVVYLLGKALVQPLFDHVVIGNQEGISKAETSDAVDRADSIKACVTAWRTHLHSPCQRR